MLQAFSQINIQIVNRINLYILENCFIFGSKKLDKYIIFDEFNHFSADVFV